MNILNKHIINYLEKLSITILAIFTIIFPLIFLSATTDGFTTPKQILLIGTVTLIIIIFCLKSIVEGKVKLKNTPFNLPIIIFTGIALISAIFSVNRYDSLATFVPLFFIILLYFAIINIAKTEKAILVIISSLTLGSILSAIITITSYFKIYLLPFSYTRHPLFNTYGSLLDEIIYLTLILPLSGYFAYNLVTKIGRRKKNTIEKLQAEEKSLIPGTTGIFTGAFVILAATIGLIIFSFLTTQKPLILPFETGFQTAFASISQDTGKTFKSFLLGSGYGTYLTDFTRFKQATYNLNPELWTFTFFRSSSFILELIATTGFLGLMSFLFLIFKIIKEKSFFLPVILAILAAFILPFSFTITTLFFILLAIFTLIQAHEHPQRFKDSELTILSKPVIMPLGFTVIMLIIIGLPNYFVVRYFVSDIIFQNSLIAANQNQGLQTYNNQKLAIETFPYRDIYHRGFAQTNLALANALASSNKSSSPSAEVQDNILKLIQQSITSGRNATAVSPHTAFNWNTLSAVYRSLIGFGQNADQFSLLTAQQAIALDPTNPQQYVEFGGIYYQLGLYDNAIQQFTTAANLKRDYANAYYNLGHALEEKGDFLNALNMYKTVQQLVSKDEKNVKKINEEIKNLEEKIGEMKTKAKPQTQAQNPETNQEPLDVNKPAAQLPERDPQANIPAPGISITPLPSPSNYPSQTPSIIPTKTQISPAL